MLKPKPSRLSRWFAPAETDAAWEVGQLQEFSREKEFALLRKYAVKVTQYFTPFLTKLKILHLGFMRVPRVQLNTSIDIRHHKLMHLPAEYDPFGTVAAVGLHED